MLLLLCNDATQYATLFLFQQTNKHCWISKRDSTFTRTTRPRTMDTPNSSLGVSEDKVASYTPARKRQRTENDKSNAGSNQKEKKKEAPPHSSILSFFKKTKDTASATVTPTKTSAVSSRSPDASSTANFVSPNSIDDDRKPAAVERPRYVIVIAIDWVFVHVFIPAFSICFDSFSSKSLQQRASEKGQSNSCHPPNRHQDRSQCASCRHPS